MSARRASNNKSDAPTSAKAALALAPDATPQPRRVQPQRRVSAPTPRTRRSATRVPPTRRSRGDDDDEDEESDDEDDDEEFEAEESEEDEDEEESAFEEASEESSEESDDADAEQDSGDAPRQTRRTATTPDKPSPARAASRASERDRNEEDDEEGEERQQRGTPRRHATSDARYTTPLAPLHSDFSTVLEHDARSHSAAATCARLPAWDPVRDFPTLLTAASGPEAVPAEATSGDDVRVRHLEETAQRVLRAVQELEARAAEDVWFARWTSSPARVTPLPDFAYAASHAPPVSCAFVRAVGTAPPERVAAYSVAALRGVAHSASESGASDVLLHCGGDAVVAAEWAPLPVCTVPGDHYLAVSVRAASRLRHAYSERAFGEDVIQLWHVPRVTPRGIATGEDAGAEPRVAFVFTHAGALVRQMRWHPAAAQWRPGENNDARLGVLAVLSGMGDIALYAVPNPVHVRRLWTAAAPAAARDAVPVVRLAPLVTLSPSALCGPQTAFDWPLATPERIVAGTADGVVLEWKLTPDLTDLAYLRSPAERALPATSTPRCTVPVSAHRVAETPIASVRVSAEWPHLVAVAAVDIELRVLDLRVPDRVFLARTEKLSAPLCATLWPARDFDAVLALCDDGQLLYRSLHLLPECKKSRDARAEEYLHRAHIGALSESTLVHALGSAGSDGRVTLTLLDSRHVLAATEERPRFVLDAANVDMSAATTLFLEEPLPCTKPKPKLGRPSKSPRATQADVAVDDMLAALPGAPLPQRVFAWNPNASAHTWVAYGGDGGVLRVRALRALAASCVDLALPADSLFFVNRLWLTNGESRPGEVPTRGPTRGRPRNAPLTPIPTPAATPQPPRPRGRPRRTPPEPARTEAEATAPLDATHATPEDAALRTQREQRTAALPATLPPPHLPPAPAPPKKKSRPKPRAEEGAPDNEEGRAETSTRGKARKERSEGQFVCAQCGARYKSRFGLRIHKREHTGERPYQCPHCEMSFTNKPHMNYHIKTRHAAPAAHSE